MIKFFVEKLVIFRLGKLVRNIGLGEESSQLENRPKNLRSLKVIAKKLVSVKNSELEIWWKNI